MSAKTEDIKDDRVPSSLYWSTETVAEWIEKIGFPFYKVCFLSNKINGRRLILMNASTLPDIGITDFEHIKFITKNIRELLGIEDPPWDKSISLPPRESLGMYLERKCPTGKKGDKMTYTDFIRDFDEMKWKPPLSNHCLIQD